MSRIDDAINKMQDFIKEVQSAAINKTIELEEDGKKQVKDISDRTIDTINNSIKKLEEIKASVNDDNELEDFLHRIEVKCKDVSDFTVTKINSFKPIVKSNLEDLTNDLEKGFDNVKNEIVSTVNKYKEDNKDTYDKFTNNDYVKNAIKLINCIKDKLVKFYNDPKTQKAINEAKLKAIELAELGLDKLKEILDRENKEE